MASQVPFRSLKRNYFFSAVSAFAGVAYPIVTMTYVSRALGPESLGKYYFANSLTAYFLFAAGMGLPVHGNREVGRVRGDPGRLKTVFSELFALNFVSSLLVTAIFAATVLVVPDLRAEARLFAVLGVLFLGGAFSTDFLYAGLERQDLLAFRSLAAKAVGIVLILALVHGPPDYVRLATAVVLAALFNAVLGLGALKYWAGLRALRLESLKRHLRPVFFIALGSLFINVYVNLDSVMLGMLTDTHQVGLYNAAIRPARLVITVVAAFTGAALARLTLYMQQDEHASTREALQRKSLDLLLLLSTPVACLLIASAGPVVRVLYGVEFLEAIPAMRWAGPLVVINGLGAYFAYQILLPRGGEKSLIVAAVAAACASVALNFVFVPWVGMLGSVWATLAAETVSTAVQALLVLRMGRKYLVLSGQWWKYGVAGLALIAVLLPLEPLASSSFVATALVWAVGGLVYLGALGLLREPLSREVAARLRGLGPRS